MLCPFELGVSLFSDVFPVFRFQAHGSFDILLDMKVKTVSEEYALQVGHIML